MQKRGRRRSRRTERGLPAASQRPDRRSPPADLSRRGQGWHEDEREDSTCPTLRPAAADADVIERRDSFVEVVASAKVAHTSVEGSILSGRGRGAAPRGGNVHDWQRGTAARTAALRLHLRVGVQIGTGLHDLHLAKTSFVQAAAVIFKTACPWTGNRRIRPRPGGQHRRKTTARFSASALSGLEIGLHEIGKSSSLQSGVARGGSGNPGGYRRPDIRDGAAAGRRPSHESMLKDHRRPTAGQRHGRSLAGNIRGHAVHVYSWY